jgi:hypothetical protein
MNYFGWLLVGRYYSYQPVSFVTPNVLACIQGQYGIQRISNISARLSAKSPAMDLVCLRIADSLRKIWNAPPR